MSFFVENLYWLIPPVSSLYPVMFLLRRNFKLFQNVFCSICQVKTHGVKRDDDERNCGEGERGGTQGDFLPYL